MKKRNTNWKLRQFTFEVKVAPQHCSPHLWKGTTFTLKGKVSISYLHHSSWFHCSSESTFKTFVDACTEEGFCLGNTHFILATCGCRGSLALCDWGFSINYHQPLATSQGILIFSSRQVVATWEKSSLGLCHWVTMTVTSPKCQTSEHHVLKKSRVCKTSILYLQKCIEEGRDNSSVFPQKRAK